MALDLILFKHYLPVKTENYTRFSFEDGGFSRYGEKTVENAVRMCIGEPEHFNEFLAKYWPNEYEMDQGEG